MKQDLAIRALKMAIALRRGPIRRLPDRARRDAVLRSEIERVFEENWRFFGVRKVWRQLVRDGFAVARCTVAKLVKGMGLRGIIRGKPHRTTALDKKVPYRSDKVNRQFHVPAPSMGKGCGEADSGGSTALQCLAAQLWVSDFTQVVSRMWWKLLSSGLRACEVGSSQAAGSRDIGSRG